MLVNEMLIFYHVVKLKSFSQAALKLKTSKSYISKHISKLEKELNVRLLNRSTRQISLTEEGEIFFRHCESVFKQAELSYEAIANLRSQASGTLKLSVPPAFALHILAKPLAEFNKANPQIKLDINLDSQIEDIIERGYDLVIRSAVLTDSNLIVQKIHTIKTILCASPDYLNKYGKIKDPKKLVDNQQIAIFNSGKVSDQLNFISAKQKIQVDLSPILKSNSLDFILQMVLAGNCIAALPEFMIKEYLLKNDLVECLPEYTLESSALYAIYPDKKFIPARVKTFIEQLRNYLESL